MTDRVAEDLSIQLMLTDPRIARISETLVREALDGFALTPTLGYAWLTRAIQGGLYCALRWGDDPKRQSNAQTRDELAKLASRVSAISLSVAERSSPADSALWDFAWRNWRIGGEEVRNHLIVGTPPDYERLDVALAELNWLSRFLRRTSESQEPQGQNWRRAEERELRIIRAQCLAPIYEDAFGVESTINTWETAKSLGPWADFYQRISAMALGERGIPDLQSVLALARRRHKADKMVFGPGIIPDKPL